ncbi:MAG TPA: GNAT family N-acetyltransferase [Nocardioides sp.]|uniref:GNAT family N-acetyltransferase n=1 Tax=Nocardioides sp. TaxID=35761 RepID=UPI002B50818A|nr:GNAT family N-acetyltransferase [Nocardioides sp.]HTW17597.1 GNAT family N-acetyltransferase [Nocardioides sp.]
MRLAIPSPTGPGPDTHVRTRLPDGGYAALRPLRAGETGPLDAVFDGLSPRSRQRRYLVPMPRLPGPFRRLLTDVDGCDHVAWLALVHGRPAGLARYVRTGPDRADLAFEVVDAHHGRGIGSVLVDAVGTVAVARGITWLEAVVEPGNAASLALLGRLGIGLSADGGLLAGRGRFRLPTPARVDRAAVLALAARTRCGDDAPVPALLTS